MKELYTALFNIQNLGLTAKKDTQAYNYKYADLEQIWGVLREPLSKNGLVVIQEPIGNTLITKVVHVETEKLIISETPLITSPESKNTMQDLGSAITYARRYALCSMFNIITNDDDNASATLDKPAAVNTAKPSAKQLDLAKDLLSKAGYSQEAIDKRLEAVSSQSDASELIGKLLKANGLKEKEVTGAEFDDWLKDNE